MKSILSLSLTALFAPAIAKVYTGFNYGAFWAAQTNVKRYADFHHAFELAKNLSDTPVPFDSARLYTCISAGTKGDPTEAFQAAIDTDTNLLLGMWIFPGATGQSNEASVENELAALGKGFEQHGQQLADLVIGLSVGSEDIYRYNSQQAGVGSDNLLATMQSIRGKIAAAPWAKYMQGKPIGHTDTATNAVVPGSDFVGLTAYPYWDGQSIDDAGASFLSILRDTERRAGNTSVWISEVGWPIDGTKVRDAVASADNYQRYWSEVGCQLFGKHNTFWFELLQDSTPEQPDWGLLDAKTYTPRINDLSCGGRANETTAAPVNVLSAASTSMGTPEPTTLSTVYVPTFALASGTQVWSSLLQTPGITSSRPRTVHTTITRTITLQPSPTTNGSLEELTTLETTTYNPSTTPSALPFNSASNDNQIKACILMTDLRGDGVFMPVITYASDPSTCTPPPQFTGSPLTMIVESTSVHPSTEQKSSLALYAVSAVSSVAQSTTARQSNRPACVTAVRGVHETAVGDEDTYPSAANLSCPHDESSVHSPHTAASPQPIVTQSTLLPLVSSTTLPFATATPSPTPDATICLKHGTLARIHEGMLYVIDPPVACPYPHTTGVSLAAQV